MEELVPIDFNKLIEEHREWYEQDNPRLGNVVWNKQLNTLELYVYPSGSYYEIDLDRCQTKADLLDWIFHLTEKFWYKDVAYDLLMMFKEVLPSKLLFR
jgi:hypothetical protein